MHRFPEHCKPCGSVLSFPSCYRLQYFVAGSAPGSAPAERDVTRAVASLLHQWFVELPPGAGMDARPAVFAVILQTGDVGTEEGGELPTTACALALITHLIIQHIWLHFHPFVNVIVLELHKASADGCNVALLIGERHAAGTFRVLQLWVRINASIADTTVQTVHDHCQFNSSKGSWNSPNKDSFSGVQRLRTIHYKVTVT